MRLTMGREGEEISIINPNEGVYIIIKVENDELKVKQRDYKNEKEKQLK